MILFFQYYFLTSTCRKGNVFPRTKQQLQIWNIRVTLRHFHRRNLVWNLLWSESEALTRAFSHNSTGSRSIWRSGPVASGGGLAGACSLVWATAWRRHRKATKEYIQGGEQWLEEVDGAEGRAPMGGKIDLVGIRAGGDEGWFLLTCCAKKNERREAVRKTTTDTHQSKSGKMFMDIVKVTINIICPQLKNELKVVTPYA